MYRDSPFGRCVHQEAEAEAEAEASYRPAAALPTGTKKLFYVLYKQQKYLTMCKNGQT